MTALTETALTARRSSELGLVRIVALLALGAALWFAAALTLRMLGPHGVYDGLAQAALYAGVIPVTAIVIWVMRRILAVPRALTFRAAAIATMAALFLDALAFGFVPQLYGAEPNLQIGAAAAVFWGAGVAIALGWLMNERA